MDYAATLDAVSEGPTTLCKKDEYRFVVDEPAKLGGRDMGETALLPCKYQLIDAP